MMAIITMSKGANSVASPPVTSHQTKGATSSSSVKVLSKAKPIVLLPPYKPLPISIRDGYIWQGNNPMQNVGVVMEDLFTRVLAGHTKSAAAALKDASKAGAEFVRFPLLADITSIRTFNTNPTQFLAAYSTVLTMVNASRMQSIPTLTTHPDNLQAAIQTALGCTNAQTDIFQPGSQGNDLIVACAKLIAQTSATDPRVLFWVIGDDLNSDADSGAGNPTSVQVAALLKAVASVLHKYDKHHLVCSGNGAFPVDAWNMHLKQIGKLPANAVLPDDTIQEYIDEMQLLTPKGIDILSTYLSPEGDNVPGWLFPDPHREMVLSWIQYVAGHTKMPLYVASFGAPSDTVNGKLQLSPWLLDALRRLQATAMPLATIKDWEPLNPAPSNLPFVVSWATTPTLASALQTVNSVIADAQVKGLVISVGPPLPQQNFTDSTGH